VVAARVQQVHRLAARLALVRLLKVLPILHDGVKAPFRPASPRMPLTPELAKASFHRYNITTRTHPGRSLREPSDSL
jgi:hypothetical protein